MRHRYKMQIATFLILIGTALCIPQCSCNNKSEGSSFGQWIAAFFAPAKQKFDFKNLQGLEDVYPIVVIGSGPAGSAAALYGARDKHKTLVIEGPKPGGLLTETSYVENWPGIPAIKGKDLMENLKTHSQKVGATFIDDTVEKVDFSHWPYKIYTEDGKIIHALTLIIATGASPKTLNIPGEKEYWGKGVTTCAICDAPFYQDKNVVVIGGGDSAVVEAMQLASFAKNITILVRKESMRAAAANQELLQGYPNVKILYNREPQSINGDQSHVTGITVLNNKTKEVEHMPIDGVFLAIGHQPNTDLFKNQLQLDKNGYIVLMGHTQATSVPGVFAAGDVEDHRYRQANVAGGSGTKAALDAERFLTEIGFSNELSTNLQETQKAAAVSMLPSLVRHVASLQEFEDEIKDTDKPILVDFYADYCPSCMQMLPHFESVAHQFKDYAVFISIDIAALPDIAKKYFINKIPAVLVFKEGSLAARYSNALTKKELQGIAAEFVGHTPLEE